MRYRYLVNQSIINGTLDSNRVSDDTILINEAPPYYPEDVDESDYLEVTTADTKRYIKLHGSNRSSTTHYSVYRTQDIDSDTADAYITPNTFIWVDDVPKVEFFWGVVTGGSPYKFTIYQTSLSPSRLSNTENNYLNFINGNRFKIVKTLDLDLTAVLAPEHIDTISGFNVAYIGEGIMLKMSLHSKHGNRYAFKVEESRHYLGDMFDLKEFAGYVLHFAWKEFAVIEDIKVINGEYYLIVNSSYDISTMEDGFYYAVVNPVERWWVDSVDDDTLQYKKNAGDPLYINTQRYMKPLPNSDIAEIGANSLFASERSTSKYQYSQNVVPYRIGYYRPIYQENSIPAEITAIKLFQDRLLAIFAKAATYVLDLYSSFDTGEKALGEYVITYGSPFLASDTVGVVYEQSILKIGNSYAIVFCSDRSVRLFDGKRYGDDITTSKVGVLFKKYKNSVSIGYSENSGIVIWGKADDNV